MIAVRSYAFRLYWAAAIFTAAALVLNASAMLFDERLFNGVGIWDKPLKFWTSITLHFATLALLLPLAPATSQHSWLSRLAATTCVAAGLFETIYISTQAARGRASHFSTGPELEVRMYQLMGIGAVLLVVASFVVGVQICRSSKPWTGLRWGAVLGLIIGSVLTLFAAGLMSGQSSHFFGLGLGAASDADGIPLLGWSVSLPDLRPPHFVATHMMQALPIIGLLADKIAPRHSKWLVFSGAVTGCVLVAALLVRAVTV